MGIFKEKREWRRSDFRKLLREAPSRIPGTGGKHYSSKEREKLEREVFPERRFGSKLSGPEVITKLRELRREEQKKTGNEKIEAKGMRKYLEEQTGLKGKY